jgi:hypothetical protein
VGTILWPVWLHEDAADRDYTNDDVQTALYDAFSSVYDVLTGQTQHPIMDLFSTHMAEYQTKLQSVNPHRRLTDFDLLHAGSEFSSSFSVPILAGDVSLAEEFISNIKLQIGRQYASLADDLAIMSVGQVLFNLVILRTYMARPPENDLDIFELVEENRVSRVWTGHELALASCFGEDDTGPDASFLTKPNPFLWSINALVDSNLERPHNSSLVTVHGPVVWTARPGLTGGSRKPRHYKPPHLRQLEPPTRPKPRPAYANKSPNMGKRAANTMDGVNMPTAKRGRPSELTVTEPNISGVAEDKEHDELPARLRRGTRTRTAVKR